MSMQITFLIITIFFAGLGISNKSEVPEITGSSVSREDAESALEFHNKVRKEVNVQALEWSAELAEYAQEWAEYLAQNNGCEIAHRGSLNKAEKNFGENIFWGSGKEYSALYASEAWYSEIEDYTYQPIKKNTYFKTGHYTQMVWKDSRKVGFGKAKCASGATIIVANYDPPGNFLGQKPY